MIRSGSPTAGFFLFEVACLNTLKISSLGFLRFLGIGKLLSKIMIYGKRFLFCQPFEH